MADYRVGFIVGDEKLIDRYKEQEYWIESGVPSFIQEVLAKAFEDYAFPSKKRKEYRIKRDVLLNSVISPKNKFFFLLIDL